MLEKTIDILKHLDEEFGHTVDIANAKLIHPMREFKSDYCDYDTAFLCELYPRLTEKEIADYSSGYKGYFPQELKALYSYTNGFTLLNRFISVAGLQDAFAPILRDEGRRTTSLMRFDNSCNAKRQKKHWGDGKLFFAIYQTEPQIFAFFDCNDPSLIKPVHISIAGEEEIIKSWPSFDDWFFEEAQLYLNRFFNNDYNILDVCGLKFISFDK